MSLDIRNATRRRNSVDGPPLPAAPSDAVLHVPKVGHMRDNGTASNHLGHNPQSTPTFRRAVSGIGPS
eukprot:6244888-Alexandrium_andersonii.AAC.1